MAKNRLLITVVILVPLVLAGDYPSERILDVRQVIRDALQMMRNYPAPTSLMQTAAEQQPQQQQQTANYYAQQQQSYYPPRRVHGVTTYNGGVESQVDKKYGERADSQINYPAQISRWFATPTQQDMEKLFHLPADIMHRLAADAGYIRPSEEQTPEPPSYKSSGTSDQSFSFNIENSGGSPQDLNSFIASLQNQPEVSTQAPTIDVPGPPLITTRQIVRDGKQVSIPILIIPQKGGENIYVPFSDMQQLSDAVNKIISTGHYQLTTPKRPEEEKPFPVPGPMPMTNVQVEPPMQPMSSPKVAAKKPKVEVSGGFVQSFDEKSEEVQNEESAESKEEAVTTTTTRKPTTTETTTIPTTKPTISPKPQHSESKKNKSKEKKNEIVLNGQRYKLVAVETSAEISTEAPISKSSEEEVKKTVEREDQLLPMTTRPEQRQYSLKELEELYNKENALATRGDVENDDYPNHQRQRIMELREKFARERSEIAKQTKETFLKVKSEQAPKVNEPAEQRCVALKTFARKYGVMDVDQFARNNCQFIESSFPDLKCSDIERFIAECKTRLLML